MGNDAAKKWQDRWGGFVHPHPVMKTQDGAAYYDATPGMTLRDWFAGQFLAGAAVGNDPLDRKDGESLEAARARYWGGVAAVAYSAADAMIAARKGGV